MLSASDYAVKDKKRQEIQGKLDQLALLVASNNPKAVEKWIDGYLATTAEVSEVTKSDKSLSTKELSEIHLKMVPRDVGLQDISTFLKTESYYGNYLEVPIEVTMVWIIMQTPGPLVDGSSEFYEFTNRQGLIANFDSYLDYARKNNKRLFITASNSDESVWYHNNIKYKGSILKQDLYRSPDRHKNFFGAEVLIETSATNNKISKTNICNEVECKEKDEGDKAPNTIAVQFVWDPKQNIWRKQIILSNGASESNITPRMEEYVRKLTPPERNGIKPWESYRYIEMFTNGIPTVGFK